MQPLQRINIDYKPTSTDFSTNDSTTALMTKGSIDFND